MKFWSNFLSAVIYAAVVVVVLVVLEATHGRHSTGATESSSWSLMLKNIKDQGVARIIIAAALLAFAYFGTHAWSIQWVEWILLVLIVGTATVYMVMAASWAQGLGEALATTVFAVLAYGLARYDLFKIVAVNPSVRWVSVALDIWAVGMPVIVAFLAAKRRFYDRKRRPKRARMLGLVLLALIIAIIGTGAINTSFPIGLAESNPNDGSWDGNDYNYSNSDIHFYNLDMEYSEEPFNFGPDPTQPGWVATDYREDLKARSSRDPALLAAITAYVDAVFGTRYMGEFYAAAQQDWAAAINAAKEAWLHDESAFRSVHDNFWTFLEQCTVRMDAEKRKSADQFFMNPFTSSGVPDVIVLETDQNEGPYLIFALDVKTDQSREVALRIRCGYQPTNCEAAMGVKPEKQPPQKTPPTKKPQPQPKPTPTPKPGKGKPEKNPEDSSSSGENDDPGPGQDTNNKENPDVSSADDEETGSGAMESKEDDYDKEIDKNKEANQKAQQQEQSDNTPSYDPPTPPDNVSDNGKTGTGHGGADDASKSTAQSNGVGKSEGEFAPPA